MMPQKIRIRKPISISGLAKAGILPEYCLAMIDFGNGKANIIGEAEIASGRLQFEFKDRSYFSGQLSYMLPRGVFYINERREFYFPDSIDDSKPRQRRWIELTEAALRATA